MFLHDHIADDSPDPLVAKVSEMYGAVLVSLDSDFKTLAPRMNIGQRRFRKLSRVGIKCKPRNAARIVRALSLIEHEWKHAAAQHDPRMIVDIGESSIRTYR
ncbi:MAG: hypothetical protein A49_10130 [Methyloceanibacter sp.]|nr:MAG: hypothetical protein A49_10130 [Methyloceanibacter sp.]